ncbi:MAG: polyhydroxyalkanoate depolymerase [Fimbriimonadales bacterium]|nr:MAG: polyhydroxyalkanoate depolymerase [Fimbriimonadales bacterium]
MRWRELYPEWQEPIDELLQAGGTTLVLGATDVGKSTFCSLLLKLQQQSGRSVGFVDLDVGQTTVGPPAAFSGVLIDKPYELLSELTPHSMAFLGDVSPVRYVSIALAGARRVLDDLAPLQPDSIVIDTDGYIGGWHGRAYKLMLIDLLRPQAIVALQRADELAPILGPLRLRADWKLYELGVPQSILRKSPPYRAQHRRVAFARYFAKAQTHTMPLERFRFIGKRLGSGQPLSETRRRFLGDQVRAELLHAEMIGDSLHLIVRQPLSDAQIETLMTLVNVNKLVMLPQSAYHNLLIGLIDYTGRCYGLGLIETLDYKAGTLSVLTPVCSVQPVRWVQLGYLRILPDGTELGEPLREG